MLSEKEQSPIYDLKVSVALPGLMSGCMNTAQELAALDLAMKLHYIRVVYYFKTPTFDGLTISNVKETMYSWLGHANVPCGRIRRTESGRPFIKCNDSGVRLIEVKCRLSLDEWLGSSDDSRHKLVVPNPVLGPDMAFSPLVMIQLTDFKCGGKSVMCLEMHFQLWASWTFGPNCLQVQAKICEEKQIPVFECICVVIWQSLAKVRDGLGPKIVTICKSNLKNRPKGIITNKSQTISVVKTDISAIKYEPLKLGRLIMNNSEDEKMKIEEAMGKKDELPDFLIYGANLSFVDMSEASFYGMEVRGQKPVYVNCVIDNIGDEGVVLVLPTPKDDGRIVSITLPENEAAKLRSVLKQDWCIA